MKVFLLKDIEKVGIAGELISVTDGYAQNFLFPRKLAVEVTPANEKNYEKRHRVIEKREAVLESRTSMLAEKIKSTVIVLKTKIHDDKLYGSVAAADIVELMGQKGIVVGKNQIVLDKAIKKAGTYTITIRLSSRLQPTMTLKIVPE